jgi:hypothetical protein
MQSTEDWTVLERFEKVAGISRPQDLAPEDAVEFLSTLSIDIDGNAVTRLVMVNVPRGESALEIVFREATSRWRQGLHVETDGSLKVAGARASKFVFWRDTAPETVVVTCESNSGKLRVWNVWDTGKRGVDSLINCAGIMMEPIDTNHWTLRCNDGYPDRDFNDLIVDIRIKECAV